MSTSNGQDANATTFNNAFMSRTSDTNTTGKLDLDSAAAVSGSTVADSQRELATIASQAGTTPGAVKDAKPSWSFNQFGSNTDSVKTRADVLTNELNTVDAKTVDGPASSTDNAVARYNLTTGKLIQDSGVLIDDSDNITGVNDLAVGNDLTVTGNLQVDGTTTTLNTATLDVEDVNVTINKNGNQATADDTAGITVEMSDATDAVLIYDKDATSKWKAGETGSEKEIVTISDVQVITAKDIDGLTASDTNRITLPKDTTTNLDALADKEGTLAYDITANLPTFNNGAGWTPLATAVGGSTDKPYNLENIGLALSVGSSALTIALKQSDGSTDATGGAPVAVSMRDATATNGAYNKRTVTGALSLVIPSGATLGHVDGVEGFIYVYLGDNAGTLSLSATSVLKDEGSLQTVTAIGTGSDANLLYGTALTTKPVRLIVRMKSTQTTAGTWDAVPTEVSLASFQVFQEPVVSVIAENTAGTSIGSNATLVFPTETEDTHGEYTTGVFMAPVDGRYLITVGIQTATATWSGTDLVDISVKKNAATFFKLLDRKIVGVGYTGGLGTSGTGVIKLIAGDTLAVQIQSSQTVNLNTTAGRQRLEIIKVD